MDPLAENDLKELLNDFSDYAKCYTSFVKERKDQLYTIELLKESLKAAQDSEMKMRSKLKEKQESIIHLQHILNDLVTIKDQNACLKNEIQDMQTIIKQEREKHKSDEEKWNDERENILNSHREEMENMKKIRNMEVSSLNREISRIKDDHNQKLEFLKREYERIEEDYKRTVLNYEEKLTKMSRDLISAQSELKNLRQYNTNSQIYMVENKPTKERYIPQPLAFTRFRPLVPIIATASQMYDGTPKEKPPEPPAEFKEQDTPSPTIKKKRKLYSRSDDTL